MTLKQERECPFPLKTFFFSSLSLSLSLSKFGGIGGNTHPFFFFFFFHSIIFSFIIDSFYSILFCYKLSNEALIKHLDHLPLRLV
jgi:hypothetical protein